MSCFLPLKQILLIVVSACALTTFFSVETPLPHLFPQKLCLSSSFHAPYHQGEQGELSSPAMVTQVPQLARGRDRSLALMPSEQAHSHTCQQDQPYCFAQVRYMAKSQVL